MTDTERGEWKLVTAEGCEDGSLRAAYVHARGNPGALFRADRHGFCTFAKDKEGVLRWGDATKLRHPVQMHALSEDLLVFHPAPKPLTREDVDLMRGFIAGVAGGGSPFLKGAVELYKHTKDRPLPEFPRRIKFSEQSPPEGVRVVVRDQSGDLFVGRRHGFVMKTSRGVSYHYTPGDWWAHIPGEGSP